MADLYWCGRLSTANFNDPIWYGTTVPIVKTGSKSGTTLTIPSGTAGLQVGMIGVISINYLGTITAILSATTVQFSASGTVASQTWVFSQPAGRQPNSGDDLYYNNFWNSNLTLGWSASYGGLTVRNLTNNTGYTLNYSTTTSTARIDIYGTVSSTGGSINTGNTYPRLYFQTGAVVNTTITTYGLNLVQGNVTFNSPLNDAGSNTSGLQHDSGTITLNADIRCNSYASNNGNTRGVAGTGNINIVSTTANQTVINCSNLSNYTWSGSGYLVSNATTTRTIVCGNTGQAIRGPNIRIQNSGTPTVTGAIISCGDFDWSASSLVSGLTVYCYSWSYSNAASIPTNVTCNFVGTGNWGGNGRTIATVNINHTGTTTLTTAQDHTAATSTLNFSQGTIELNSLTMGFVTTNITGAGAKQINGPGDITMNVNGTFNVTGGSAMTRGANNYNIYLSKNTAKTFAGGGGQWGTLINSNANLTITGSNTFYDIQTQTVPTTITFEAASTQTLNTLTLSGSSGNLVNIRSTVTGTQYTFTKPTGTVTVNYLSIQDSNVTGGAYWGTTTSTFVSNNTGWNLSPSSVTYQFMPFF